MVYLPVVQKYAKDKAVAYVERHMGLKTEIGNFSLKFPFRVQLDNVFAGKSITDTLLCAGQLRLDIGLSGILKKEIAVRNLSLQKTCFNYSDTLTGMCLRVKLDTFRLVAPFISLREKQATVSGLSFRNGDVRLTGGNNNVEKDTTPATPFDWTIDLQKLELAEVRYLMNTSSLPYLSASLERGIMANGRINTGTQQIRIDSVEIAEGACRIRTLPGKGSMPVTAVDEKRRVQDTLAPWLIEVGTASVADYAFSMEPAQGKGFELNLSRIAVRLDSIYNRGTTIRADLKDLRVVRQEGGEITRMEADVDLDERKSRLTGVYLLTPNSRLRMDAMAESAMNGIIRQTPLSLTLDAVIGMKDVALFLPQIPRTLEKESIHLKAALSYQTRQLEIDRLLIAMPGNVKIEGRGNLSSLQNWREISGNLALKGNIENSRAINDWLKEKINIPSPLTLTLNAEAEKGIVRPDFRLCENRGCLLLSGEYNFPEEKYDLQLRADTFSLASFLPSDSLGILTAEAQLKGQGLQWSRAQAQLTLDIRQLAYKHHLYTGITLAALLAEARLEASLKSVDPDLLLALDMQADSIARQYLLHLTGNVEKADLKALNLTSQEMTLTAGIKINASAIPLENYTLDAWFSRIGIDNGGGMQDLGEATLLLNSTLHTTQLNLTSGDFRLDFQGDTLVTGLSALFGQVAAGLRQQIAERHLDMTRLQHTFPRFHLYVKGHSDNIIGKYLKAKKIGFKNINIQAEASPEKGVNLAAEMIKPFVGNIDFDSVTLNLNQEKQDIAYRLKIISGNGAMKDLYQLGLSGTIGQNGLSVLVHQQDRQGRTGVNIGGAVTLGDSTYSVRLFPASPVLGTSSWTLNPENQILFYKDRRIEADLDLGYEGKTFSLHTYQGKDRKDQLEIEIKGINLTALSRSIPFVPDLGGLLNTDLLLSPQKALFDAEGEISIDSFSYQNKKIGNLQLDVKYALMQKTARHTLDAVLQLDGVKRVLANGYISTSVSDRTVALRTEIPSLPLGVISAFMPGNLLLLYGDLHGKMDLSGTLDRPSIDGQLAFRKAGTEVVMLGTRFSFDSTVIPVRQGKIYLDNFGLTAPNKKRLEMDGQIALLPWERMACDLSLRANNFQIVNVKENQTSLVYGKAYIDLNVGLNGPFQALNLTGNVNLLNNTVLDYVLRNSSPELKDHARDLVRFVSFRDSTQNEQNELTNRINTGSFSMKLLIEIGEAVSMNINLSEDGNNRVSIQGGGNLIYSMNPESGNNLVGKYILGGGMVRYGLPVVGEKNFTIQNGSYIEWTGNLMEPILHITAATAVRVSVTEDNQSSRIVNFEVLIRIEDDLRQPRITFDLTAPNDQAIQTQLAAFSAEERTKQAMNLLIYGTYTGPGTVNTGTNANNTLNNFVEKELNQWTRKYLKNTNLTFGIDTYNQIGTDGQEVKRTDYSYQFSKQLFNDKINVKVGGRISSDNDPGTSMEDNLIDDIAIEYMFTKKRNLLMKVFRHTNYESVLEGEVTQTGIGIVWRKSFRKLKEIFQGKKQKNRHEN